MSKLIYLHKFAPNFESLSCPVCITFVSFLCMFLFYLCFAFVNINYILDFSVLNEMFDVKKNHFIASDGRTNKDTILPIPAELSLINYYSSFYFCEFLRFPSFTLMQI